MGNMFEYRCPGVPARSRALALATPSSAQPPAQIQQAVDAAYPVQDAQRGKNADIFHHAKVDPGLFGIALVTADGRSTRPVM